MNLRKTDRRFKLYNYGFDCYIEFECDDWKNHNRCLRYCNQNFGEQFWLFNKRVYRPEGKWRADVHKNKNQRSKRIYFRGEKYYTLLILAIPAEDENTFHL